MQMPFPGAIEIEREGTVESDVDWSEQQALMEPYYVGDTATSIFYKHLLSPQWTYIGEKVTFYAYLRMCVCVFVFVHKR